MKKLIVLAVLLMLLFVVVFWNRGKNAPSDKNFACCGNIVQEVKK